MTDLEISKALALAIGWAKCQVAVSETLGEACIRVQYDINRVWRIFDYRDWNVIGPIAARYDCFPFKMYDDTWCPNNLRYYFADTPQKAIALAVIGAKK
jgi:hypothetical protein